MCGSRGWARVRCRAVCCRAVWAGGDLALDHHGPAGHAGDSAEEPNWAWNAADVGWRGGEAASEGDAKGGAGSDRGAWPAWNGMDHGGMTAVCPESMQGGPAQSGRMATNEDTPAPRAGLPSPQGCSSTRKRALGRRAWPIPHGLAGAQRQLSLQHTRPPRLPIPPPRAHPPSHLSKPVSVYGHCKQTRASI